MADDPLLALCPYAFLRPPQSRSRSRIDARPSPVAERVCRLRRDASGYVAEGRLVRPEVRALAREGVTAVLLVRSASALFFSTTARLRNNRASGLFHVAAAAPPPNSRARMRIHAGMRNCIPARMRANRNENRRIQTPAPGPADSDVYPHSDMRKMERFLTSTFRSACCDRADDPGSLSHNPTIRWRGTALIVTPSRAGGRAAVVGGARRRVLALARAGEFASTATPRGPPTGLPRARVGSRRKACGAGGGADAYWEDAWSSAGCCARSLVSRVRGEGNAQYDDCIWDATHTSMHGTAGADSRDRFITPRHDHPVSARDTAPGAPKCSLKSSHGWILAPQVAI
ncbi:hypothetical protein FB451DRAFT_1394665 [Mycena latifolia]|nr:hypothetical protein FB451DRAFT_1394665 [Mycena latifolia]